MRSHLLSHNAAVPAILKQRFVRMLAAFLSGAGLFLIVFTLTPFYRMADTGVVENSTGNVVNQIGYLGLAVIFGAALFAIVDKRVLVRMVSPTWILVFAIAFVSCLQSWDPVGSARGLLLGLVALVIVASVLVLPRSEQDFAQAAANAILLLLLINYAALLVAPNLAIHTAAEGEPWHAGSWRGHLTHKNVAAPIFSVLCMFGIYCWRSGLRFRGLIITLLCANFVLHTASKTTIGFLPIAIGLVALGRTFGRPYLMITLHLIATGLLLALTLGTIWSHQLLSITTALVSDPTFTGRDDIWRFALNHLGDRLWLGYGQAGFWQSPVISGLESDFEAVWDVRGIVTAHNAYLDAVLLYGLPGGLTIIYLLMIKPLFDYAKAFRHHRNRRLADLFVMTVIFMTYIGLLESLFLNRADPMWLLLAMAILGLGLLASLPLRAATRQ